MEKIVFTNGCFDILHEGHINLLREARSLGTRLIVGINSDRSVRAIKGAGRPLVTQEARAAVLMALRAVDEVLIFDENTPEALIKKIKPDVLVKGGDWTAEQIVGADFVTRGGGEVFSIPFRKNISTTEIIEKITNPGKPSPKILPENDGTENSAEGILKRQVELCEYLLDTQLPNIESAAGILRAAGGRIIFCGTAENAEAARSASEILRRHKFPGAETDGASRTRVFHMDAAAFAENGECGQDDVLVIFGSRNAADDCLISAVLKARRGLARTIAASASGNKKICALTDVCILLKGFAETDSTTALTAFLLLVQIWLISATGEKQKIKFR